ncbi:MAG: aa3-type cytochrome c oxidase subunit IV [Rhizobiales bacterium]|nr:aa3-type cytochrome c oxidase subunit IV [Hyphomicrobiales bacterium]MBN9010760.1 aa3-type cytochrome c oxidase subunit IV [Hyphomicrobiales bacterium]
MAEQSTVDFNAPPIDDYAAHAASYEGFLGALKWGTIAAIVILVLLAIFVV